MAVMRHIGTAVAGAALLLGWGHFRANAAEASTLAGCTDAQTAACQCAVDTFNAEVGVLGRSMSAAPILHHFFAAVYDRDAVLLPTIAAECGVPDLFDRAG